MRYLLLVLFLSGCAIPTRAERDIARFGPYCEGLGFKADTNPWRDCIQNQATTKALIFNR